MISKENYSYDAAGNMLSAQGSSFSYDTNNRLLSHAGDVFSYDLDGNLLSITQDCYCKEFAYDSANRVTKAGYYTYTYDAEDVRIRSRCDGYDNYYVYNTNATLSQLLMKTTNGKVIKYVYGHGLIGEERDGILYVYHFDYRGSTVAISDQCGAVLERLEYDTYGRLHDKERHSHVIFAYNGRDGVITEDGMLYMRARYYSPELRRFINADIIPGEISNAITLNRYAYANGNPVSNVDPFGLAAEERAFGAHRDTKISHTHFYEEFGMGNILGVDFYAKLITTYSVKKGTQGNLLDVYTYNEKNVGDDDFFVGVGIKYLNQSGFDIGVTHIGVGASWSYRIGELTITVNISINLLENATASLGFEHPLENGGVAISEWGVTGNTKDVLSMVGLLVGVTLVPNMAPNIEGSAVPIPAPFRVD